MARALFAGAALAGASVTLFGCGGGGETTAAPATTAAPGPAPAPFSCADYKSATVQEAWDNHFGAFGEFNLDRIMCDYDDTSIIAVFNDNCEGNKAGEVRPGYSEFKGTAEIRGFFDSLFTQLGRNGGNLKDVGPVGGGPVVFDELGNGGNVFLTWRTQNLQGENQIDYATDSFSFRQVEGQSLIWKQNIVTTEPNKACPDGGNASDTSGSDPIYAAWTNHFTAFGAGVGNPAASAWEDDMQKEYDDNSVVQVFDTRTMGYSNYTGWDEIKGMFVNLFQDIDAAKVGGEAGVNVLLQEILPAYKDVFLVWEANSHVKATDTFVFDTAGTKIVRQNIVVQTKPSGALTVQV